jgi:hypothetical protein
MRFASGSSIMRETSETIAGDKVFEGGNRSFSARPMAVSIDFCAASSHLGGRPFGMRGASSCRPNKRAVRWFLEPQTGCTEQSRGEWN